VSGQNHVSIRSQHCISNPKLYTDGMIRYSLLASIGEPTTLQEALGNPNWNKAMNAEFEALRVNNTWNLVPLS
jgi:hypothetical protein